MLCILYINLVSACLGLTAILAERALPLGAARRWIWAGVIPLSMIIPGYYRNHHNWSLIPALESHTQALPAQVSLLDPGWWAHTGAWDSTINRVWVVASYLLVAWALANAWRVWRIVHLARKQPDLNSRATVDGVPILITEATGPATVGIVWSRVLVPRWVLALPAAQRQYVLRHEAEHRSAHDSLLLFLASLPLILVPWNAALWWILRRLCLAVEMDCDKRVVAALGDPHAYGDLLLRVAEAGNRGPRLQPAFLGAGMLEKRLIQLVAPRRLRKLQRVLVPSLIVALLALVVWMPHPIAGHGSHPAATTARGITPHTDNP